MLHAFKRLWHAETTGLTAAAFLIATASLTSRLVGLVRDRLLASTFGAGQNLDAYYAAFRLPDTLYNLLIVGALTTGFIPLFTEYLKQRGEREARLFTGQILSLAVSALGALSGCLVVFAPQIVPWIAPGFSGAQLALTISLTRIMSLSPLLLGVSAVMGGVLQSTRRFFAFALAPVLYNVGIIFGILVLAPWQGIRGVAWGVVVGAALHVAAQLTVARCASGWEWVWPSWRPEGVRRLLRMMGPRTAGLAVTQLNLMVLLALASSLRAGSVSVFQLASNLEAVPLGLIGISFAVAALPALSAAVAQKQAAVFAATLGGTARKILFFIIPCTALLWLLRAQVVRLILGQGSFDWDDTIRTAAVLGWFAISLPAQALVPLLARAFYAWHDTWTPFWIGLVAEAINIGAALFLRGRWGISGLAAAFSLAAGVQVILLWALLRKRDVRYPFRIFQAGWKVLVATGVMLIFAWGTRQLIGTIYPLRTFWQVMLQAGAAILVGSAAFLFVVWLARSSEYQELLSALQRRVWRSPSLRQGLDATESNTL